MFDNEDVTTKKMINKLSILFLHVKSKIVIMKLKDMSYGTITSLWHFKIYCCIIFFNEFRM